MRGGIMGATSLLSLSVSILLAASFVTDGPNREKPEVLTPVEFSAVVVRAGIKSHMLTVDNRSIMVRFSDPKSVHGFISVDQLAKRSDVRPCDKVLPLRMVVVTASFPYKKQLQEVRRALHLATLEEARKELHFAGLEIERRPIQPNGKPEGEWDKASIEDNFLKVVELSGQRFTAEDRWLKPVIFPGLVVGLPERLDGIRYPRLDQGLRLLANSLEKTGSARPKNADAEKEKNPIERETEKETDPSAIPEHCLVRIIDVAVEPGRRYEYRFKVRIRNPNFKRDQVAAPPELAKSEHLVSEWVYVPGQITIAPDLAFYAVDQKEFEPSRFAEAKASDRDQTVVQLHHWVDEAGPEPGTTLEPVGDWAVAERVLVRAGEYIGGNHVVELPIWNWLQERFVLASSPKDRGDKRIVLPFTDEQEIAPLLVDFSGGEVEFKGSRESVPRELLVLMPNGRLVARSSALDAADPDRREHYRHWRGRVDRIKRALSGDKTGLGGSGVFSRAKAD
jgi:hypothetical protein